MSLNPNDVVIVDAVRTPMGKSRNGQFRNVRAEKLSAPLAQRQVGFEQNNDINPGEQVINKMIRNAAGHGSTRCLAAKS